MGTDFGRGPEGRKTRSVLPVVATVAAAILGIALQADAARRNSATYDEPTYLRVALRWWQTGEQEQISRMGTPLTFWKLQYAPVLWALSASGHRDLVDQAVDRLSESLPMVRIGSLWIWLAGLVATAWWSHRLYGPRAMAFAAWLFALSPNLLAHGMLVTMEMPLVASSTLMFALFWRFLESGRRRWFWAAAAGCGLAWSCKFTAILYPPILAVCWAYDLWAARRIRPTQIAVRVARDMTVFVLVAILTDFVITGFATIPFSVPRAEHPSLERMVGERWARRLGPLYETPLPQDWVGFATQLSHQVGGGPSYLFGERRMKGWRHYYFVAMAVKVPLTFFLLMAARSFAWARSRPTASKIQPDGPMSPEESSDQSAGPARRFGIRHDALLPIAIACFLAITALASSRNYGIRYLLPIAPLAIVWVSALAEIAPWNRLLVPVGILGVGLATATSHPYELTYFNILAGGPVDGRRILSDSNLDWGQGLLDLARLQRDEPEFQDLTLYYFGDVDPGLYAVKGSNHVVAAVGDHRDIPRLDALTTRYVGVSVSLAWGPWGIPGFFDRLREVTPIRLTADTTIAIYRVSDIPPAGAKGGQ